MAKIKAKIRTKKKT